MCNMLLFVRSNHCELYRCTVHLDINAFCSPTFTSVTYMVIPASLLVICEILNFYIGAGEVSTHLSCDTVQFTK
jgi:hypothetical protein